MTKEQLLQLVSEAYDEGADFDIRFHVSELEAGEITDQFSEYFTSPCVTGSAETTGWHKHESVDNRVNVISFFTNEMEGAK
jgi:hypothetical protein